MIKTQDKIDLPDETTEEKKDILSHIYHPWYLQIENKIWIIIPMRKLHKIMWK